MPTPSSSKALPVAPNGRHVVGIDVGQQNHAAAALTAAGLIFGRKLSFPNTRDGISLLERELLTRLGPKDQVLIGMESTGHYWQPLYFELQRRGYYSIVINPIQTRAKFRTRIRKTKTDKLDARSIAALVRSGEAKAARIPEECIYELRILVRQRWRLIDSRSDLERFALSLIERVFPEYPFIFSKPFSAAGKELIRAYGLVPRTLVQNAHQLPGFLQRASHGKLSEEKINALLGQAGTSIGIPMAHATFANQLKLTLSMHDTLTSHIEALDKDLETRVTALDSPLHSLGLHAPLIATIHAESDPMTDFSHVWQYAAYTGLDPATYDSGKMHGTRVHISKRGSPHLRRALYLAAFALFRRHKTLHRLYLRMRKAGRHHTDALIVVAHKLARIIWRLLTDKRPFKAQPPARTKSPKDTCTTPCELVAVTD